MTVHVCAWNDLGGCDDERVPVMFKDRAGDRERYLCRKHYTEQSRKSSVNVYTWGSVLRSWNEGRLYERQYLCAWLRERGRGSDADAIELIDDGVDIWLRYDLKTGKRKQLKAEAAPVPSKCSCAICSTIIDPKGRYYAGAPRYGNLCPNCHKEVFP